MSTLSLVHPKGSDYVQVTVGGHSPNYYEPDSCYDEDFDVFVKAHDLACSLADHGIIVDGDGWEEDEDGNGYAGGNWDDEEAGI